MKKTVLVLGAICLVLTSAVAKDKKKKSDVPVADACKQVFFNQVDSMSYALGMNVGSGLNKNLKTLPEGKVNLDVFIKALTSSLKGDSLLLKDEFANEFLNKYFTAAKLKEVEAKKSAGEKFLAENKQKEGVKTTENGLQYQVLVAVDGPKPKATDSVEVHYQGFLLDGTKFDSSVDRGEPATFLLNQVIPGWTEGVQLMSVGSKYKFFVPYTLGYGEQGTPNGGPIPGFATLIFEIQLLKIKPVVEVAPAAPALKSFVAPKSIKKAAVSKVVKKTK